MQLFLIRRTLKVRTRFDQVAGFSAVSSPKARTRYSGKVRSLAANICALSESDAEALKVELIKRMEAKPINPISNEALPPPVCVQFPHPAAVFLGNSGPRCVNGVEPITYPSDLSAVLLYAAYAAQ